MHSLQQEKERVTHVLGPHEGQKWEHLQPQDEGAGALAPSLGTSEQLCVQAGLASWEAPSHVELRFEEETGDRCKRTELSRTAVDLALSQRKQVQDGSGILVGGSAVGGMSGKSSSGCRLG